MSSSDSLSSDSDIRQYSENKPYKQLERGEIKINSVGKKGGMRCPFCPGKKIKEYESKQLLQHAEGIWESHKRRSKERANHLALALYLKNHVLDQGTKHPNDVHVSAESSKQDSSKQDPLLCYPWTGIVVVKGLDNERIFTKQYLMDELKAYKPTDIVLLEINGAPTGEAIINFGDSYDGWYMASRFDTFHELQGRGKKDYAAANNKDVNIYGWFADADDYVSSGIVGDFLRNSAQLRRFSDIVKKQEQEKKTTIDGLLEKIDVKNKGIDDLDLKMKRKK